METPSTEKSVNYHYGHHHKRSDSIDLGRKGSVGSIYSFQQPQSANTTPPTSPQNQYKPKPKRDATELGLVPELPVIDLDKITEEFKKNQRILSQKEVHWCNFLKEVPIDPISKPHNSVKLPKTSETLLEKFNSNYNIEDPQLKKEKAIRKALSKFRIKD
ncbi:hypothetical protein KGF54_005557 [Candida jiufengensis]|uniref:uncharacterized protein n=1 Tax=Candida jiufengensis TaxID=497108 RepID=UPI0022248442|nr:uncharacterized protein KGF54_005557 [Candida jiufengensis]KAI5949322.1 hypothetical protein KGF54_005557 [Candida jiufengensis]